MEPISFLVHTHALGTWASLWRVNNEGDRYVMLVWRTQRETRSSWLNCALRDDEAVYLVSRGHYEAVAVGNWWYWFSRGHLCLYILHKVEIWKGVTHPDGLTTLTDRATQLLIKYKSGALVTQLMTQSVPHVGLELRCQLKTPLLLMLEFRNFQSHLRLAFWGRLYDFKFDFWPYIMIDNADYFRVSGGS